MQNQNLNTLPLHDFGMCSDNKLPFDISPFNKEHPLSYSEAPHRHTFYQIIFIKKGAGSNVIDFVSFPIRDNSLFFVSPGQVHFWGEGLKLIDGLYIIFTEEFLLLNPREQDFLFELDFFHNKIESPHLILKNYHLRSISDIIHELELESQTEGYAQAAMIRALLRMMLIRIQRIFDETKTHTVSPKRTSLVHNFKKLVSENCLNKRNSSSYAEMLGLNASYLSETVKELTGLTPTQIIRNEVILEAKRLLAYSDLTISEIGYKLNFEDPSYFGRVFRQCSGLSPNSFRMDIQKKYQTLSK
jgi:AraC family transcriptional activator of pobA